MKDISLVAYSGTYTWSIYLKNEKAWCLKLPNVPTDIYVGLVKAERYIKRICSTGPSERVEGGVQVACVLHPIQKQAGYTQGGLGPRCDG
jgi:hypothetical protein